MQGKDTYTRTTCVLIEIKQDVPYALPSEQPGWWEGLGLPAPWLWEAPESFPDSFPVVIREWVVAE